MPNQLTFAEIDERFHTVTLDQQLRVAALVTTLETISISDAIDAIFIADDLEARTHARQHRLRALLASLDID